MEHILLCVFIRRERFFFIQKPNTFFIKFFGADIWGEYNDGIFEVLTVSATTITTVEQTIVTQGTGPTVINTIIFSGDATADIVKNFAFDDNVQGGRTAATNAVCVLKAVGLETGQYVEVTNQTITRTVGLSFTATAPLERNYSNP